MGIVISLDGEPNELVMEIPRFNTTVTVFYDEPTAEEVINFQNFAIQNKGKKVINQIPLARLNYGLKKLRGLADGDLQIQEKGEIVDISTNSDSPNYRKDWKKLVQKHCSYIPMLLAAQIFEGSAEINEPETVDSDGMDGISDMDEIMEAVIDEDPPELSPTISDG